MGRSAGLSGKEKCVWLLSALAAAAALVYAFDRLFLRGVFAWHVAQPEFRSMTVELAAFFAALALLGRNGRGRVRLAGMAAVCAGALWLHAILLPLLVSGLYVLYLCLAGRRIRRCLGAGKPRGSAAAGEDGVPEPFAPGRDFLTGSAAVVLLFCLMSAFCAGSVPQMGAAVLASGAALAAAEIADERRRARQQHPGKRLADGTRAGADPGAWSAEFSLGLAFVLTMFFLQAARMNISVDYDSLWYGVRAPYVLNNGRGIYENLGSVAVVYTYPKGWETLTLPLTLFPSYSFLISFNLWMAAGVLWTAYRVAGRFMGRRRAAFLAVFLSSLPALMNMTVTAKTDVATLLVQMLMILEAADCAAGRGRNPLGLCYALAALLLSWTMKPTALVFSTAVFGMTVLYLLAAGRLTLRVRRGERAEAAGALLLAAGALAGIWARTWLLTGLPVTSVFSSLLTKIGFRLKYPFRASPVPNSGSGMEPRRAAAHLLRRLYGLVLDPSGGDMSHVILAWGGMTVWTVLVTGAGALFLRRRERTADERRRDRWLLTVLGPFLAVNLVSLFLLSQVDGNYFMLLYVLLALWAFRLTERIENARMGRGLLALFLPAALFSALVAAVSNWSWSVGFTPARAARGYYDHEEEWHGRLADAGNGAIWEILARDPRNRAVSIGSHPESLMFPCSVQSYTDITGSDGNVELVKTMDNFTEFLRYAGTDYVYAEAGWIHPDERAWSLTCNLIEYGILTPVCYESGNMLAEVNTEGRRTERSEALLAEFLERYAAGP